VVGEEAESRMEHLGGLGVIRPRTRDPSFGKSSEVGERLFCPAIPAATERS
jgi:hypothetical protein